MAGFIIISYSICECGYINNQKKIANNTNYIMNTREHRDVRVGR